MSNISLWASDVSRDGLLQKITLLALLGPPQEHPRNHTLVATAEKRVLTIDQEAEVAGNLAFVARQSSDSQNVAAVGIEEDTNGQGMVVRVTANGSMLAGVVGVLTCICQTLERIAANVPETSQSAATEILLAEVVRLNLPRIKSRLKLRKRHALESSTVVQIAKLWKLDNHGPDTIQKIDELIQLNQNLKKLASSPPTPVASQIASNIVRLAYELSHISHADGVKATAQNQVNRCLDSFEKVGQYYRASRQLVAAAKRADVRLFHRIQVRSFQTHIPQAVRKNSLLGSSTAIVQAACTHVGRSEFLKRFQDSEKVLDAAIINRLNGTRPAIKVHAEIQLLFFYECNQVKNRPRVIAASKASCYLCDLFLKTHGGFQTISTFGKLNERWILPDWLPGISAARSQHLQQVIQEFDGLLDTLLPSVVVKAKRAVDPIESLIALSATWPNSAILLNSQTDKLVPADRRHRKHRLLEPPSFEDRPGQPIGLWQGMLIDLEAIGLPYTWIFDPKNPQLQVKMGQLTLLLDFTGICTGRLAISQDGTDVDNFFDAMSLPTDAEISVYRSIGFNEISLRIIHENVFLNLTIS